MIAPLTRKPLDDEIDVVGLTHPGRVRAINQDQFLIGSLHKRMMVHASSLPDPSILPVSEERLAFLALVADGVGGAQRGEEASRLTLEYVTQYVTHSMRCYYSSDPQGEAFTAALQEAALQCHEHLLRRAAEDPELHGMATTLTLVLGVWPWLYLLQVGDSRYYIYRDGTLTQITRDQTMAQELLDRGVLTRTDAHASPWANVLSSAIGGRQTMPVVSRHPSHWSNVHLLATDGLTKHVTDERIKERLATSTSAKQTCDALLQDALDGGGTDNITVVVGRTVPRRP